MKKTTYKILNIAFYAIATIGVLSIVIGAIVFFNGSIVLSQLIILELLSVLLFVAAFEIDNILSFIEKTN